MTVSAAKLATIARGSKNSLAPAHLQSRFDKLALECASDLNLPINELLNSQNTNLINKEQALKELRSKIASLPEYVLQRLHTELGHSVTSFEARELLMSARDLQDSLEAELTPVLAMLADKQYELRAQMRWLKLGFPEAALASHADGVYFFMRSGIANSVAMFKEATAKGSKLHDIRLAEADLEILFQGEYKPWSYIKTECCLNSKNKAVSQINPAEVYTYISPSGMVKKSPTPDTLYPIEVLDPQELQALQDHARTFWKNDPHAPVECVFQLVTTGDLAFNPSWLTNGINDVGAKRTSLRLIDEEGNVYSFGLELLDELKEYMKEHPASMFATGYAKVGTPDYRDPFEFDERWITNIPISRQVLADILQLAEGINNGLGARFCFAKQNCNTFGTIALKLAGITVDTRTGPGELLLRMVPKLETVPVVGSRLSWLRNKVANAVNPLFSFFSRLIPAPINTAFKYTVSALTFIPRKIHAVASNSLLLLFGAGRESQKLEASRPHQMATFSSLIPTWRDLFDEEKAQIYHPYKLVDWQKEQKSTIHYGKSDVPTMHLLHK